MGWNKLVLQEICIEKCLNRVRDIQLAMDTAQDAILNDTKSSMGDKYETSREMAQQELSRLQNQIQQAKLDLDKIQNINLDPLPRVGLGSIVETSQFSYFIAISIGPIKVEDQTIMVVSKESPIGALLFGKQVADELTFNGKNLLIKEIL